MNLSHDNDRKTADMEASPGLWNLNAHSQIGVPFGYRAAHIRRAMSLGRPWSGSRLEALGILTHCSPT